MSIYNNNQSNASTFLNGNTHREYRGGNDMLLAAIKIAKDGFKIFPCNDKKIPLVKNGFYAATNDLSQINEWWTKWPNAAIGMPTGAVNGFWVIDCDVKNGNGILEFLNICKEHNYNPDSTYIIETQSGGLHYYFLCEENTPIKNSSKEIAPDVDVRGDGGYVIVPPSSLNGKIYKVNNNKTIQSAPSWLLDLCKKKEYINTPKIENNSLKSNFEGNIDPRIREKFEEAINAVRQSQDGSRNDTLNKSAFLCGQLVGAELLNESFARAELEEASYHLAYTDGLNSVQATIKSGIDKGKLNPYQLFTKKPIEQIEKPRLPHEWNEPIAFDGMKVPQFTVDGLPSVIGDFIAALAEEIQIPVEVPFAMAFASVAIANGGKFVVKPTPNLIVPLNLYVIAPLEPSTGKSSVAKFCRKPIEDYEANLQQKAKEENKKIESERKTLIKMIEGKRKQAEKSKDMENTHRIQKEIADLERQLPELKCVPHLLVDDVTPEMLGVLMYENNSSMGILDGEGGLFSMMAGRYQKGGDPNIDIYLKGYTCDNHKVFRVTQRTEIILKNPCLTIGLAPQPICLEHKESYRAFRERGLDGRFDYFLAESNKGNRKIRNRTIMPETVKNKFYNKIHKILTMDCCKDEYGNLDPNVIVLDERAEDLWYDYKEKLEIQYRAGGKLEYFFDWSGKSDLKVLRYAGLLHILQSDIPQQEKISVETMEVAISIVDRLLEHGISAYSAMNVTDNVRLAKRILKWIEKNRKETFILRDCQQAMKSETVNVTDIRNALAELIEREYIIRIDDTQNRGRATENYQSNAKIFLKV